MMRGLVLIAVLIATLVLLRFVAPSGILLTVMEAALVLAIATVWNMLASFGGIVFVGLPLFVGVGAYTTYVAANALGIPPHLVLPLAGAVSAAGGYCLSLPLFRLSGAQLAIGSWVMAEVGRIIVLQSPMLGAGGGMNLVAIKTIPRFMRFDVNYATALVIVTLALVSVYVLMKSNLGLGLRALGDDVDAASAAGVDIARTRRLALALTAGVTGMAAGAYYIIALQVTPNSAFSLNWMAMIIFIVVLGGIGSIEGPILGAVVFFALRDTFSGLGAGYFILMGSIAIAITIFSPRGLWGLVQTRLGSLLPIDRIPESMKAVTTPLASNRLKEIQ